MKKLKQCGVNALLAMVYFGKGLFTVSLIFMMLFYIGIAFLVIWSSQADAATFRQYTPGGAPCAGACTLEWAANEFGVPMGEAQRMLIPEGTFIHQMSYGRDGQPYAMSDAAVLLGDQAGVGYQFERDGVAHWMVKLDECENWAVVTIQSDGGGMAAGGGGASGSIASSTFGGGGFGGGSGLTFAGLALAPLAGAFNGGSSTSEEGSEIADPTDPIDDVVTDTPDETPLPAVPLPGSGWLLLGALACLKVRRNG